MRQSSPGSGTVSQALGNVSGTYAAFQFNPLVYTVAYDNDHYTTTSGQFTVPRAGIYRISACIEIDSVASSVVFQLWVTQNGLFVGGGSAIAAGAYVIPLACSVDQVVQCLKGDALQIQLYHEDSASDLIDGGTVHIEQLPS